MLWVIRIPLLTDGKTDTSLFSLCSTSILSAALFIGISRTPFAVLGEVITILFCYESPSRPTIPEEVLFTATVILSKSTSFHVRAVISPQRIPVLSAKANSLPYVLLE